GSGRSNDAGGKRGSEEDAFHFDFLSGLAAARAAIELPGECVAGGLNGLDENYEQHDDDGHHLGHEALVAVADAEITKAAAADGAALRGVADEADRREREAQHDGRARLGD